MFWTGKQSQELMPLSFPKAQHHTQPNSCWLARQGQPSLFRSQAVWHFLASKRTLSCCTIGLVTITPYWSSWSPGHTCGCQPAQVTLCWLLIPSVHGSSWEGLPGSVHVGSDHETPGQGTHLVLGRCDLEGPQPMALRSHPSPNDFHEPGTVLSVCCVLSH